MISKNITIKRKTVSAKPILNQTASITVHGIPVRRNACTDAECDNKEFTVKSGRRHSFLTITPQKNNPSKKVKRVASLPRAASLAGDFKHLKNGIKTQILKSKVCPQKSFEYLSEESMKKYKLVRDTLKLKNLCLRSDKKIASTMPASTVGVNSTNESHSHTNTIGDLNTGDDDLNNKHGQGSSKTDEDSSFDTKTEAIYENTSTYTNVDSSLENSLSKQGNGSPQKTFSYSDADLTSLSYDEDIAVDSASWENYYPTGETTPRHSLLSLV